MCVGGGGGGGGVMGFVGHCSISKVIIMNAHLIISILKFLCGL